VQLSSAMLCAMLLSSLFPVSARAAREQVANPEASLNVYVRARLAEADGSLAAAANAYREAVALDPDSIEVAHRSYRQAVLAGDKALALRSAHNLDVVGLLPRDGVVLLLIDALDRRKWQDAQRLIDRLEQEQNLAFLAPFMRSWLSMKSGPYAPPIVAAGETYAVFAVRYLEEQLLVQRLALRDRAGARDAFVEAQARKVAFGTEERWALAAQFDRLGDRDIAEALLREAGVDAAGMTRALKRAKKHYRQNQLTPHYGLALLMHRLAQDIAGRTKGTAPMSIARMAGFAAPQSDDMRLGIASAALAADYPEMAYAEAGKIASSSPVWTQGQMVQLRALIAQGKTDEAVTRAIGLATHEAAGVMGQRLLGDVFVQSGDYTRAAAAYGKAYDFLGEQEDAALLLQWGGALEQSGQWTQAKPLLERVIILAPDSPVALNHLGYALADRGEELPRAIAMLEKANRLRPGQAALIDSLGWAYYRNNQYDKALPLLENAVAMEPGNAELNEHMGDILWATGRHFEARYAWKAALVALDDADGKGDAHVRIAAKISGGVISANP